MVMEWERRRHRQCHTVNGLDTIQRTSTLPWHRLTIDSKAVACRLLSTHHLRPCRFPLKMSCSFSLSLILTRSLYFLKTFHVVNNASIILTLFRSVCFFLQVLTFLKNILFNSFHFLSLNFVCFSFSVLLYFISLFFFLKFYSRSFPTNNNVKLGQRLTNAHPVFQFGFGQCNIFVVFFVLSRPERITILLVLLILNSCFFSFPVFVRSLR